MPALTPSVETTSTGVVSPAFSCVRRTTGPRTAEVVMTGELDLSTVAGARDVLFAAQVAADVVECDLGGVTFLALAGLDLLLEAHAWALRHDTRLLITGSGPAVRRVLALTGTDEHLRLVA